MSFSIWALIIGALLTTAALSGTLLKRLPLSITIFYLAAGYGLGPGGLDLIAIDPMTHTVLLERLAEVAVLVSLFAVGLKLGLPLTNKAWLMPLRLAVVSMTLTIALIALIAMALGLPLGAAILLGAILAPTDPVWRRMFRLSKPVIGIVCASASPAKARLMMALRFRL